MSNRFKRAGICYGRKFEKHCNFVHMDNELFLPLADMDIRHGETILDHGCRNGSFTLKNLVTVAEEKNCKIYAIELSKSMHLYSTEQFSHHRITYLNKCFLDPDLSFGEHKINKIFSMYALMVVKDYRGCLKKMHEVLEEGGKACILIVSKVDTSFKFMKHLKEHPEWNLHDEHLVIPDWVETYWNGGNHTEVIKDAVTSAGFTIEKLDVVPRHHDFASKADCAEFLYAGTMTCAGEHTIHTLNDYEKIQQEYVKFLSENFPNSESSNSEFRMEYELTIIIAKK